MFFNILTVLFLILRVSTASPPRDPNLTSRIIGGVDAPEGYSPHMAALIYGDPVLKFMCGGSIISRTLVLTAAHCIEALLLPNGELTPSFRARVGSNQWNSGGTVVQVTKYYIHPQWDSKLIKYDGGVLVLAKPLVLSDRVGIVALNFNFVGPNEKCAVTGWGRTGPRTNGIVVELEPLPDSLQLLYVDTIDYMQCQQQLLQMAEGRWTPPVQKEVEICTFHSRRHGMCTGDSGSALKLKYTGEQVGVVSWGLGCATGAPDMYLRLSAEGVREFLEFLMHIHRD